ncbi:hypothetical protein [Halorientalis brevis]|uniref:hypothetical protein n=1 Tax=Halorientalis brevis TaxID=1126241 RepID=UPI001FFA9E82|nr:hypothetical protein [Halorientalis brevis]
MVSSRVTDEAVEYIASLASGNARQTTDAPRKASQHCVQDGIDQLTVDVVNATADDAAAVFAEFGEVRHDREAR